ncbi:hypothetical protein THAOC_08739, partial [Thalassiosira oceanica]
PTFSPAPSEKPSSSTYRAKLMAPDGAAGDQFGRSVAMYGDAIVVGAALMGMMTMDLEVDRHTSLFKAERSGLIRPSFWRQMGQQVIGLEIVSQSTEIPLLLALMVTMTTASTVSGSAHVFVRNGERGGLIRQALAQASDFWTVNQTVWIRPFYWDLNPQKSELQAS